MKRNTTGNGAGNRAAKTSKPQTVARLRAQLLEDAIRPPAELAASLARHIAHDGLIPLDVTVRLSSVELMLAARRACETGETIQDVVEHVLLNGRDDRGGLLEALRDYEGEIPDKGKAQA